MKLGPVRIQETQHTFIHNYPLKPIRDHLQKLDNFFFMLLNKTATISHYDRATQLSTVRYEKEQLKSLIRQIHPEILNVETNRTKRGLFNAIGSVFKFVSGNLDAGDGEKYDNAINELKTNQENLIYSFNKQYSLNHELIRTYNEIFRNISYDMELIHNMTTVIDDERLTHTVTLVRLNILQLKDLILNIQTALNFATLNVLHMSIISENQITMMKTELGKFNDQSSYYSLDNILFTKTISVDYYITPEHIVFLLHIPILNKDIFNLYHLYSIPTAENTIIIPPTPYVAMLENSIIYLKNKCKFVQQQFFCSKMNVERNFQQDTCIKNLLQVKQNPKCRHVPVNISDSLVETINDEKYLVILPNETLIHEKCGNEEVHKLKGVFLIKVPYSCSFIAKEFQYRNLGETLPEEPVYLPPLDESIADIKPIHLNLKSINLDELSKLTLQPQDPISYIHQNTPWTYSSIPAYFLIGIIIVFMILYIKRKQIKDCFNNKLKPDSELENEQVNLKCFPSPSK